MAKYQEINNPYTLQFSYIPPQFIRREQITQEIINNYIRKVPTYRGMFITGVRGIGKTVMLGDIRNKISEYDDWITIDLNPETDLLDSLARSLYLIPKIKALFVKARLDFSFLGIGLSIENAQLVASNEEDALKMMLEVLKKTNKKIFITIDEITYSKNVAKFSHALSSYAGAGYDIYALMTGLSENINAIKNQKSLTFLYRAKIIELDNLNLAAIRIDYQRTMGLRENDAKKLAQETKGYSFAFQAMGYHCWNALCQYESFEKIDWQKLLDEFDATLYEMSYSKIWNELSAKDRQVLRSLNKLCIEQGKSDIRVEDIRADLIMTSNTFATYRKRLKESGVVSGNQYGYLSFALPRFGNFISEIDY